MAELTYKINGDASNLKKSLSEAVEGSKKLEESIKGAAEALGLMYLAEKGLEFLKDGLKESFEAFSKAETAAHDLSRAVNASGGVGKDLEELNELADKLSTTGIFSETDIKRAETMQLQLGLTAEQVKKLIPLAADMAAGFITKSGDKLSIDQMTGEIDKFLRTGKSKILAQLGIIGGEKLSVQGRENLLEKGGLQYKGADEDAALNTPEGRVKNLQNAWEKLQEKIGEGLADAFVQIEPTLKDLIKDFGDLIGWIKENKTMLKELTIVGIGGLITAFIALNVQSLLTWVNMGIETAIVTGEIFFTTLATDGLSLAFTAVGVSAGTAWAIATLGLSAVITGLIVAYNKSANFRAIVNGIGATLYDFGRATGLMFEAIWEGLNKNFGKAISLANEANKIYKDVFSGNSYNDARDKTLAEALKTEPETPNGKGGLKKTSNLDTLPSESEKTRESITLNITKLVETLEINTTNLSESKTEIKAAIAEYLQEAVNSVRYVNH